MDGKSDEHNDRQQANAPGPQILRPQVAMSQAGNWQHQTQPPLVYQVATRGAKYDNYNSKMSRKLGIAQLVAGVLAFVANVAGIVLHTTQELKSYDMYDGHYVYWDPTVAYYVGCGIWCAVFVFLSGSFALCAAQRKSYCTIIAHMVLAILGSVFSFVMLAMSGWAVGHDASRLERGPYYNMYDWRYEHYDWSATEAKGSMFLSVMFLLASLMAFVTCTWSSTLCCKVLCCCDSNALPVTSGVHYVTNQAQGRTQMLILDQRGRPLQVTPIMGAVGGHLDTSQPQSLTQAQNVPAGIYMPAPAATPVRSPPVVPQSGSYLASAPPPYSVLQ